MRRKNNKPNGRRKFIKLAGSGVALGSIATITSAKGRKSEFRKKYKKLLKRRTQHTDINEFRNQLLQMDGVSVYALDREFVLSDDGTAYQESGDLSTQKLDKSHVTQSATLTLDRDTNEYAADHSLRIRMKNGYYGGEKPYDFLSIGWDEHHYNYLDYDTGFRINRRRYDGNGIAFEYPDWKDYPYGAGEEEYYRYATAFMEAESGTTAGDRQVRFDYRHTWNDVTVESVSISSTGGLSVTLSNQKKGWQPPMQMYLNEDEDLQYRCPDGDPCPE